MIFTMRIQILDQINLFKKLNKHCKMISYLIKINKVLEIKDLILKIMLNNKIINKLIMKKINNLTLYTLFKHFNKKFCE